MLPLKREDGVRDVSDDDSAAPSAFHHTQTVQNQELWTKNRRLMGLSFFGP